MKPFFGTLRRATLAAVAAMTFGAAGASAVEMGSMQIATDLGEVLGSENACGLSYDQAAIRAFIDQHVQPDDISFPSDLSVMTSAARRELREMTTSQKIAHCAQISRVARSYHFIR